MRVLVVDAEPGPGDDVVEEIRRSGHVVATCRQPGEPAFSCAGTDANRACPLDTGAVDVALAVGDGPDVRMADAGARCAIRRSVPLVTAGAASTELASLSTTHLSSAVPTDVVAALEQAAAAPLGPQSDAALSALREVLAIHGLRDDAASADALRTGDAIKVTLHSGLPDVDARVREIAAVRALAAVRAVDPHASRIGVSFED